MTKRCPYLLCIALALSTIPGCADSTPSFRSSLDSSRPIADLDAAEANAFCLEYIDFYAEHLGPDFLRDYGCTLYAIRGSDDTEACEEARLDCIASTESPDPVTLCAMARPKPACDPANTVRLLEGCYEEPAASPRMPDCSMAGDTGSLGFFEPSDACRTLLSDPDCNPFAP